MAACSCHVLILQQLQLTQLWGESLCEGKSPLALKMRLSRLESTLLELGMATGGLDHSKLSWAM